MTLATGFTTVFSVLWPSVCVTHRGTEALRNGSTQLSRGGLGQCLLNLDCLTSSQIWSSTLGGQKLTLVRNKGN